MKYHFSLKKNEKKKEIITEKMYNLIHLLQKWDYEYYILDNPTVTDVFYDYHLNELKKLESEAGFIVQESPTNKINSEIYK